ncbi:MAG: hypothetical protein U9O89_07715 [Thermoproteota archaeon]|nr:hypothetical protein [Thermoproteota archaeon]
MSSHRLSKAAVAIGGFLIFIGVLMVGVFALTLTKVVDVDALEEILENVDYQTLFLGVLLAIGAIDVISGVILRRR